MKQESSTSSSILNQYDSNIVFGSEQIEEKQDSSFITRVIGSEEESDYIIESGDGGLSSLQLFKSEVELEDEVDEFIATLQSLKPKFKHQKTLI